MKQILFIGMSPNKGGVETFMMDVFLRLEGHGFHFTFLNVFKHKLAYQNVIINHGGTIKQVVLDQSLFGHLQRYNKAKSFFKNNHNYDIVHLNAVTINVIFWLIIAKQYGIKKLIIHSHNSGMKRKSRIVSFLVYLLSIYSRYYLESHNDIIKLAASMSCGKWMFGNTRFTVIDNGINSFFYRFHMSSKKNVKEMLNINLKNKVIITVARLAPQKNYPKIIRIFKEINRIDKNIILVIVGNGPLMPYIKGLVKKLKLSSYVMFLNSQKRSKIPLLLSAADLMLMPSLYEGMPFSLIESQASGVPSLVSSEAIPKSANVTNEVFYLSLSDSDKLWAKKSLIILNSPVSTIMKLQMNDDVSKSKYNVKNTVDQIRKIYLS